MPFYSPNQKGQIGVASITSNFVSATGSTPGQVTGLTLTFTVPSALNGILLYAWAGWLSAASTGSSFLSWDIWDGVVNSGTRLAASQPFAVTSGTSQIPGIVMAVATPTAGTSKTYNVGVSASNTNNATVFASSTSPAFLLAMGI